MFESGNTSGRSGVGGSNDSFFGGGGGGGRGKEIIGAFFEIINICLVFLKVSGLRSGVDVGECLADFVRGKIHVKGRGVKNLFFVGREKDVHCFMSKDIGEILGVEGDGGKVDLGVLTLPLRDDEGKSKSNVGDSFDIVYSLSGKKQGRGDFFGGFGFFGKDSQDLGTVR